ncbi:hypothetical protein BJX64DRAFT_270657 [Aspergillus heterothallicus]
MASMPLPFLPFLPFPSRETSSTTVCFLGLFSVSREEWLVVSTSRKHQTCFCSLVNIMLIASFQPPTLTAFLIRK